MSPLRGSDPREIDGYTLTGRLGAGGFGVVYVATAPDGREVALKVLRPELSDDEGLRTRLGREAEALRSVRGDRNVQVFDVVTEGDWAYLVMELVEGDPLDKRIADQGPLRGPMLWYVARGLVEALAGIHAAGIIHRDLKPSNVMYGPDGIKVLDFGVSVIAERTSLTQAGSFIGTASWISPEQVLGEEATTKSDVFSLGLVLAYTATGQHPFGQGRADAVMYRISSGDPDLTGLTSPLLEAVERCLDRDPQLRPTVTHLDQYFATRGASSLDTPLPVSDSGTVILAPDRSVAGVDDDAPEATEIVEAPEAPEIVKDVEEASFDPSWSVPPFGLVVFELKVCVPAETVMLGSVTASDCPFANDPVHE